MSEKEQIAALNELIVLFRQFTADFVSACKSPDWDV